MSNPYQQNMEMKHDRSNVMYDFFVLDAEMLVKDNECFIISKNEITAF